MTLTSIRSILLDMEYKSTGIRLEGTGRQIDEALRRLGTIFHFSNPTKRYPSRDDPSVERAYLRAYTYEPNTLLNQLEAAQADLQRQAELIGELQQENDQLKQQLGILPSPKPGDAVLGGTRKAIP